MYNVARDAGAGVAALAGKDREQGVGSRERRSVALGWPLLLFPDPKTGGFSLKVGPLAEGRISANGEFADTFQY